MATFTKLNSNFTVFAVDPFNNARAHCFGLNGRLAGFLPAGNGTGSEGPGLNLSGATYFADVTLNTDANDEKIGTLPAASYAIANGVLLESVGSERVVVSKTGLSPTANNPIVLYAFYDSDPDVLPTFDIDLRNNVNLNPKNKAILCHFSVESVNWVEEPQISIKGLVDSINTITQSHGGFTVKESGTTAIEITPGVIITTNGRVLNSQTKLVAWGGTENPFPTFPNLRHDLIVVLDPEVDGGEGVIQVIKGVESPTSPVVPGVGNPLQIPIASVIVDSTSITELINRKPDLAWQTDVPRNTNPSFVGSESLTDSQPSIIMNARTDESSSDEWGVAVFRTQDPSASVQESKIVIGKISTEISRVFQGPSLAGAFTPTFDPPLQNYIIKKTISLKAGSDDVTENTLYGPGEINLPLTQFDCLSGNFYVSGGTSPVDALTSQSNSQYITILYKTLDPLIAFSSDGTRIDRMGIDFYDHISTTNSEAHTADNIQYNNDNRILSLPSGTYSTQTAIDAVAEKAFGTAISNGNTVTNIPSTFWLGFGQGEQKNAYSATVNPSWEVFLTPYNGSNNAPVQAGTPAFSNAPFLNVPRAITINNISTSIACRFVSSVAVTSSATPATSFLGTTAKIRIYKISGTSNPIVFEQIITGLAYDVDGTNTIINVSGSDSIQINSGISFNAGEGMQMTVHFPNGVVLTAGSFVSGTSYSAIPQSFLNVNSVLTVTSTT